MRKFYSGNRRKTESLHISHFYRKERRRGFTMVELMVVLVIIGIIAAIAIPTAIHYIRLAQFNSNQQNAKTAYMAAESRMTYYRNSGKWEEFVADVQKEGNGIKNTCTDVYEEADPDGDYTNRIYAIVLDASEDDRENNLVYQLLDGITYDKSFYKGAIALEIDVSTGEVYSAFYATKCDTFIYGEVCDDGTGDVEDSNALNMNDRTYDSRKERLMGYYSADDLTSQVDLTTKKLKVTSVNLVNGETLALKWSSNSSNYSLDTEYDITFYNKADDSELFKVNVNFSDLFGSTRLNEETAKQLLITPGEGSGNASGETAAGDTYYFPLSMDEDGTISLVLDGMMSAQLQEKVNSAGAQIASEGSSSSLAATSSRSITRLASTVPVLATQQNIYAEITAKCTYQNMNDTAEYTSSSSVTSNWENTLFARTTTETGTSAKELNADITAFRHLYNINYVNVTEDDEDDYYKTATYTFTNTKTALNWKSVGTGVYDVTGTGTDAVNWVKSTEETNPAAFPSIRTLYKNETLTAESKNYKIQNLYMDETSVAGDNHYLGMFREVEGTITNLTIQNPSISYNCGSTNIKTTGKIYAIGVLAGRMNGTCADVTLSVKGTSTNTIISATLNGATSVGSGASTPVPASVGGLFGVLKAADTKTDQSFTGAIGGSVMIKNGKVTDDGTGTAGTLSVDGAVNVTISGMPTSESGLSTAAASRIYGVGGIAGSVYLKASSSTVGSRTLTTDKETGMATLSSSLVSFSGITNKANVKGNGYTGGVFGQVMVGADSDYTKVTNAVSISGCKNNGLVLSNENTKLSSGETKDSYYFGGILGYGQHTTISGCTAKAGASSNYIYDPNEKADYLLGSYVGGILGSGDETCQLTSCTTEADGYVLGKRNVGGIAGALTGITDSTNGSYVIGDTYVGGIVGRNADNETVTECTNNGVVAGYGNFIGGIVGYNGKGSSVIDCVSYFGDYSGSTYKTIVEKWEAVGNYVGGLVGYNNGKIEFKNKSGNIDTSKHVVSGIVVGGNYVGGFVGFNDVNAEISANYAVLGGKVNGKNCVGGFIGLNAATGSTSEATITAQPGSVTGETCVGGVIGANITKLSSDSALQSYRVENAVGSITGNYFVGGVIGYQRNYTGYTSDSGVSAGATLLSVLYGENGKNVSSNYLAQIIPTVTGGIPKIENDNLLASSTYVLTVDGTYTDTDGTTSADKAINNKGILVKNYGGGVVGYCDTTSRLVMKNCINTGSISANESAETVSLCDFARYVSNNEAQITEADDVNTSMVGGIISVNLQNQVIDTCTNSGTIRDFGGMGGIVGVNMGYVVDCSLSVNFGDADQDNVGGIVGYNIASDSGEHSYVTNDLWEAFESATCKFFEPYDNAKDNNNYYEKPVGEVGVVLTPIVDVCKYIYENKSGNSHIRYANISKADDRQMDSKVNNDWQYPGLAKNNSAVYVWVQINDIVSSANKWFWGVDSSVTFPNPGFEYSSEEAYIRAAYEIWYAKQVADGVNMVATRSYTNGTVEDCTTTSGKIVSGKSGVGGIVAYNMTNALVTGCTNLADVNAYGNNVGGVVGKNAGKVSMEAAGDGTTDNTISSTGNYVGGLVGWNESAGTVTVSGDSTEIVAVASTTDVTGNQYVGGIVGNNLGTVGTETSSAYLVNEANVTAEQGYAGGIIGSCMQKDGTAVSGVVVSNAINRATKVEAKQGLAGGIIPEAVSGMTVQSCTNEGSVTSSGGNVGGIAAEVASGGVINNCTVSAGSGSITISSKNGEACGAVCAVNYGKIYGCAVTRDNTENTITLSGTKAGYGAIAGINKEGAVIYGYVKEADAKDYTSAVAVTYMPAVSSSVGKLCVGGVAAYNDPGATVQSCVVTAGFTGFSNYQYLGGIVGYNKGTAQTDTTEAKAAVVSDCKYAGTITESGSGSAGNCYGGIAGDNYGRVSACRLGEITFTVNGVYSATSASTAEEKEAQSSHLGGIVGKNEEIGVISECYLTGTGSSSITAANGMVGGVAGYNKGTIQNSGDIVTATIMNGVTDGKADDNTAATTIAELCTKTENSGLKADTNYVSYSENSQVENLTYNSDSNTKVSDNRMKIIVSSYGNLGGITAYNAPTGSLEYCVTGNWFLNNKSDNTRVGTGGVIGMNESEKDLGYLVNQAFVSRQRSGSSNNGMTNYFAGGVIGFQSNATTEGWTIKNCINYGTVYIYNSHYAGGILGQWTANGGTIEGCRNYGNLQTTYGQDFLGAAAGIVAQLYHASDGQDFNIISCENHGSVYMRNGARSASLISAWLGYGANDSAGILGNVTAYKSGQSYTIRVLDCANASGVNINSGAMACGIVGFLSSDDAATNSSTNIATATQDITLQIERCRNFATLTGSDRAGIFGDRYGGTEAAQNTTIKDCYSADSSSHAIVSMNNRNSAATGSMNVKNNYFLHTGLSAANRNVFALSGISLTTAGGTSDSSLSGTIPDFSTVKDNYGIYTRADGKQVYAVKSGDTYILVYFKPGASVDGANYQLSSDGRKIIKSITNEEVGYVLCKLDGTRYYAKSEDVAKIVSSGNLYYTYVRDSYEYQDIEGEITDSSGKATLIAPKNVTATVNNGKATFTVQSYTNSGGETCDPFRYEVQITVKNSDGTTTTYDGDDGLYFYDETGSVTLPISTIDSNVTFKVRAVSMYDDVNPSAWSDDVATTVETTILPQPDVRLELVYVNGLSNYRYRVSLDNLDKYETDSLKDKWQVTVTVNGRTVTLNSDNKTAYLEGISGWGSQPATYKMVSQATPLSDTVTDVTASAQKSEYVYLPNYAPYMRIQGSDSQTRLVTPTVTVSGSTLDDLSIMVSLADTGSSDLDATPVYRAELVGTWTNPKTNATTENVTFGSADILVQAKGTASAQLDLKKDYLKYGSNFKIRIWYAASGQGPVYTYYNWINDENSTSKQNGSSSPTYAAGKDQILDGMDSDGNPTFSETLASPVLLSGEMGNYKLEQTAFELLDAPVLTDYDSSTTAKDGQLPVTTATADTFIYTISWDPGKTLGTNQSYQLTMTGKTADGKEVVIDTSDYGGTSNSYEISAEKWNYESVTVQVTKVDGTTQSGTVTGTKSIGATGEATYSVKQRLAKPTSPTVSLVDENEMYHTISWSEISDADLCGGYEVWLEDKDGTEHELAVVTKNADGTYSVTNKGTNTYAEEETLTTSGSRYTVTCDFDDFEGQNVNVYVVAVPSDSAKDMYVQSAAGTSYAYTVPTRIEKPTIGEWNYSWVNSDNSLKTVTIDDFENGGLTVTINNASKPTAGSDYVLQAQIYKMSGDAQSAVTLANSGKIADLAQLEATYPAAVSGTVTPKAMSGSGTTYSCNLKGLSAEYAGYYIVFYARISSGSAGNISSLWAVSAPVQLPKAQLATPTVTTGTESVTLSTTITDSQGKTLESDSQWSATQKTLTWTDEDYVDTVSIVADVKKNSDATSAEDTKTFRLTKKNNDEESIENGVVPTLYLEQLVDKSSTLGVALTDNYVTATRVTQTDDEIITILQADTTVGYDSLTDAQKEKAITNYRDTHYTWKLETRRRRMLYASALSLFLENNNSLTYYDEAGIEKTTTNFDTENKQDGSTHSHLDSDGKYYAVEDNSTDTLNYFYQKDQIGGYERSLSGYDTNNNSYSTTMVGELTAVWDSSSKKFTYQLTLPDADALVDASGNTITSIAGANLSLTADVKIMNGVASGNSGRYADSETATVTPSSN